MVLNAFELGFTNYLSFGGGIEVISTFSPDTDPVFYLKSELAFPISDNEIHVGGNIFYGYSDGDGFGIVSALSTFGGTDNNVTFGVGFPFAEDVFIEAPALNISFIKRLNRSHSFVSENWLVLSQDQSNGFISYGLRTMGEKIAVDLAFVNNKDIISEFFIGVPYLDFVVKF